jgi:hypothetical protein
MRSHCLLIGVGFTRWAGLAAAGLVAAAAAVFPLTAPAATIVVNSTNDPSGFSPSITVATLGSTVTLRDAVNAANNTGGSQTITFAPSLAGATIYLLQVGDTHVNNSALAITGNIAITGPSGGLNLSVAGAAVPLRHFYIAASGQLALNGLTLRDANLHGDGGVIYNLGQLATTNVMFTQNFVYNPNPNAGIAGRGGAIFNTSPGTYTAALTQFDVNVADSFGGAIYNDNPAASAVTLLDSELNNDYSVGYVQGGNTFRSGGGGGAIYNNGGFSLTRTDLGGDTGNNQGGAIYNDTAGTLTLTNCYFEINSLTGVQILRGGAIFSAGSLLVIGSTFQNNTAGYLDRGGAIATMGATSTSRIINSSFTGNSATFGAGVAASGGTMLVDFCTFTGNNPSSGYVNSSGIMAENGAAFTLRNTILWDVSEYGQINGSVTLISCLVKRYADGQPNPTTGSLDVFDGGPTLSYLSGRSVGSFDLYAGSQAINAGTPVSDVTTDQRGSPRDAYPDIGSSEYQPPTIVSASATSFAVGQRNTFLVTAGGASPLVYYLSGSLPAGVAFTTNGLLSGIPAAGTSGSYPVTITASNNFSPVATQGFTLNVVDGRPYAATPNFDTSGLNWALNGDSINGGPNIVNNVLTLTDGAGGENRSAWYEYPLFVGGFQASFTYQDVSQNGADGVAFVIQNDPRGLSAIGAGGGGLAYVGITPSVAVMMDIYSGSPGGPSGVLVATNGQGNGAGYSSSIYQSTAPVNLDAGNPINVTLTYLKGILFIQMADTVTSAVFQTNIPVNIPGFVGTNTAWVGITGSEGGILSHQAVSNFSYTPLAPLALHPSAPGWAALSWPASVYGAQVLVTSSLNPANWTTNSAAITLTNGLAQVLVPITSTNQFFRLNVP